MKELQVPKTTEGDKPADRRRFLTKALGLVAGAGIVGGASRLLAQVVKKSVDSNGNQKQVDALNPFLGQILMSGFNFAPVGWALCDGSLLPISQNTALFSLLGTQFGGDGISTFALPDLRGRVPISQGQGAGLSSYSVGQRAGEENHTLLSAEMPSHTHVLNASAANGTSATPSGNFPAVDNEGIQHYASTYNGSMSSSAIASTGGSNPHNNMQPYLCVNFIIALTGIFPSRS
jgi:microcystin-dependent protein